MTYYSLNGKAKHVNFETAVRKGLAEDKGLYFPEHISALPKSFYDTIENLSPTEIGYQVIKQFVGDEIPENDLKIIISETLDFKFPVVSVEENVGSLELYHGPTLAFKDVGARFMARCLGYFNTSQKNTEKVTVLVATSGDTGGAVANGFYNVEGVNVVILYPSGKVSHIQEQQLTTLGGNIEAIEVNGTFDDCQAMVKKAFLDKDFKGKRNLTSANSINVARWLPQMFYFFLAYKQLKSLDKKLVFSVPSGNYGNICAGMMAQKLGLPISHFVAGTNENDIVPEYLKTGIYTAKPSVATISNAMDVGDPSNFIRIQKIHDNDDTTLKQNLSAYCYSDTETEDAMIQLYKTHNYIADPHGAIGYLALKKYQESNPDTYGVFLETAHPCKFLDVIPKSIVDAVNIPQSIKAIMDKEKKSTLLTTYTELKEYLLK